MEKWLPVVGWEGLYEVSDKGRVRRVAPGPGTRYGRVLNRTILTSGYPSVMLQKRPRKPKRVTVHSIVAAAFIGPRGPKMEVNHKDGDRTNAAADNLEYMSRNDNLLHAYRVLGRARNAKPGATNPKAKLTPELVSHIRRLYEAGGETHRSLAARFGVAETTVAFINQRRTWKHVA